MFGWFQNDLTRHLLIDVQTIIQYAQDRAAAKAKGEPLPALGRGIGAAIGLFCLTVCASVCQHQWFWRSMSLGVASRAALINSLLARGLALTPESRIVHTNGKLVNHVSTDISRIDYFFQWCHPVSIMMPFFHYLVLMFRIFHYCQRHGQHPSR